MKAPSHSEALQVLLYQLADEGRSEALTGPGFERVGEACSPFLVGDKSPSVYLELPLTGEPYLDITILYNEIAPGTRIDAVAAEGVGTILDWFSTVNAEEGNVSFGFELDTSRPELPRAAVHFQPRARLDLVEPFCEAAGEPERAKLYLDMAARMPEGWPLSFFGMFRGRPGSPLRVCGYLSEAEKRACADDAMHLAAAFDDIGFRAYDKPMLTAASELMATAPGGLDFQFDVYPDGHLGDVFAIDAQFEIEQPCAVRASFENGGAARLMGLFERWGTVDGRWRLTADAAFARSLLMERGDGSVGKFAFTLFPQWTKARWRAGVLQPAKLYFLANGGFLEDCKGFERKQLAAPTHR